MSLYPPVSNSIEVAIAAQNGKLPSNGSVSGTLDQVSFNARSLLYKENNPLLALVELSLGEVILDRLPAEARKQHASSVLDFEVHDELLSAVSFLKMSLGSRDESAYNHKALACLQKAVTFFESRSSQLEMSGFNFLNTFQLLAEELCNQPHIWLNRARSKDKSKSQWGRVVKDIFEITHSNFPDNQRLRRARIIHTLATSDNQEALLYAHGLQYVCQLPYRIANFRDFIKESYCAQSGHFSPRATPLLFASIIQKYLTPRDKILGMNIKYGSQRVLGEIDLILSIGSRPHSYFSKGIHLLEIKQIKSKKSLMGICSNELATAREQLRRAKLEVQRHLSNKVPIHCGIVLVDDVSSISPLQLERSLDLNIYRSHAPLVGHAKPLTIAEFSAAIEEPERSLRQILAR